MKPCANPSCPFERFGMEADHACPRCGLILSRYESCPYCVPEALLWLTPPEERKGMVA